MPRRKLKQFGERMLGRVCGFFARVVREVSVKEVNIYRTGLNEV